MRTPKSAGPKYVVCPLSGWIHRPPRAVKLAKTKKEGCYTGLCSCSLRFFINSPAWEPEMGFTREECKSRGIEVY